MQLSLIFTFNLECWLIVRNQYKLVVEEDKTIILKTKLSKEETIWPEEKTLSMEITKNVAENIWFAKSWSSDIVYVSRTWCPHYYVVSNNEFWSILDMF